MLRTIVIWQNLESDLTISVELHDNDNRVFNIAFPDDTSIYSFIVL